MQTNLPKELIVSCEFMFSKDFTPTDYNERLSRFYGSKVNYKNLPIDFNLDEFNNGEYIDTKFDMYFIEKSLINYLEKTYNHKVGYFDIFMKDEKTLLLEEISWVE